MNNNPFIPIINSATLLFIDMQERLLAAMPKDISDTITKQKILLEAAKNLKLKVIVTEQYPKGLGVTAKEISSIFAPEWPVIEKSRFSSLGEQQVRMELEKQTTKTVILAGVETHVCVLQTAIDCIAKGYRTIILTDAVNSRKSIDKETAFITAQSFGVVLMTVESILFVLMRDSKHPAFRSVSKLLV